MRLDNKVALIAGAASGMGASMAQIFAAEGAKVVAADVLEEEGKAVVAEITRGNGAAMFHRLDVSNEAEWRAVVEATLAAHGRLDILVNDAGLSGSAVADLFDTAAWDTLMAVNARGVFLGMKFAIPVMKAQGGGAIVNISSISGITGQHGVHVGYNASKGAVRTLTKAAAVQHGADNIRINSVHPGLMPPMRSSGRTADPEVRANAAAGADGPRRPPRRGCQRRSVFGLGRSLLHYRGRAVGRWRLSRHLGMRVEQLALVVVDRECFCPGKLVRSG